ncbi:MAG: hypothetical protein IT432_11605 [Phycisphaerales bacterium]|nr:hypothetical protein [Phycisphaerales bacterium]
MKNANDTAGARTTAGQWLCIALFVVTLMGVIAWSVVSSWQPWTRGEFMCVCAVGLFGLGIYIGEKGARRK